MSKITRKFTDFTSAMTDAQTVRIWDIEITNPSGIKAESKMLRFRASEVGNVPPAPTYGDHVKVGIGGYTLNFIGKTEKSGTMTIKAFDDIDGKVAAFIRDVRTAYFKSGANFESAAAAEATSSKLSSKLKFTVKVQLGDEKGDVKQRYAFFNAMMDLGSPGITSLTQDTGALSYTMTFAYEYFTEGDTKTEW